MIFDFGVVKSMEVNMETEYKSSNIIIHCRTKKVTKVSFIIGQKVPKVSFNSGWRASLVVYGIYYKLGNDEFCGL